MMRLFVCTVALAAVAGAGAVTAAERVTYIMNDGQQKSGTIGSHGQDGESRYGSFLSLMRDGAGEERVQLGDVAVMDFGNGAPPVAEVQSLPSSSTANVLVLKNGTRQEGTFIDFYNGSTVRWRNQSNQTQEYPIGDVSRIYINPQAARSVWATGSSQPAPVATSGGTQSAQPGQIQVQANQAWTNTGMVVRRGDRYAFQASGQIAFGQGATQTASPDGNPSLTSNNYPLSTMPVGGLIGRVGNSAPFRIGAGQTIAMPAGGVLMLGVNDNELGDNSGYFSVMITKQ